MAERDPAGDEHRSPAPAGDGAGLLHEAAAGLAALPEAALAAPRLVLLLDLSLWLRRAGFRVPDPSSLEAACRDLLSLRRRLLELSGLDPRLEPSPLLPSDPAVAVESLACYLHGLLRRAAHALGSAPAEMAAMAAPTPGPMAQVG